MYVDCVRAVWIELVVCSILDYINLLGCFVVCNFCVVFIKSARIDCCIVLLHTEFPYIVR